MAVKFNVIVSTKDIPDSSWNTWTQMGYDDPIDYLRVHYRATEVMARQNNWGFWRAVRFRSRRAYAEFYLKWM